MSETVRIALLNDHQLVVEGLRALLGTQADIDVVELDTLRSVSTPVDLALLDTYAKSQDLATMIRQRLAEATIERVAVFTWSPTDQVVDEALQAGASGVLSKTLAAHEIAAAVKRMSRGEQVVLRGTPVAEDEPAARAPRGRDWPGRSEGLSMRESEMISLICQGLSNEQIAQQLYLSPNSVKSYIRSAYHKAGVTTRAQAVIWGIDHGLRPHPSRQAG